LLYLPSTRYPEFVLPGLGIHPVQESEPGSFDRSALVSDWTELVKEKINNVKDSLVCIGES